MNFKIYLIIILSLTVILQLFLVPAVMAQDNNSLTKRAELINASKELSLNQNQEPNSSVSLYVTNFHAGDREFNLGAKYENKLFKNRSESSINVNYVAEAIYLEGEEDNLIGFLSLKASLKNKLFNPYFGAGAGFLANADYQAFLGLNLTDNFFVETKFINDEEKTDSGDFYSAVGFKINF